MVNLVQLLLLSGCYVTGQAWHQNNLLNSRRPILLLLQEILAFAGQAGLNVRGAYRYYIELPQPVVSYLVYGAKADRLEAVTWWFPIVGRVPYLGFFDKGDRDDKAGELEAQGYDVYRGAAAAFSSLGWFEDPVFSSMLRRRSSALAHLFFHELTHRTYWAAGSAEFNENLAEFVAHRLTREFLEQKGSSQQLQRYEQVRRDRRLFKKWLTAGLQYTYGNRDTDFEGYDYKTNEVLFRITVSL